MRISPCITRALLPLTILILNSGCATTGRTRFFLGISLGAGAGAAGGIILSPNDENRPLNALIFGLSGALLGGVTSLLTDSKPEVPKAQTDLRSQDLKLKALNEFPVLPNQQLPQFVKDRLQPLVIEEFIEADTVSEDGTLHEPHKAYRVKNPRELFAKPVQSEVHNAKN
jgi:hypothetical protein